MTAWTLIYVAIAGASAVFAASEPAGMAGPATILAWVFSVLAVATVVPRLVRGIAAAGSRRRTDERRANG